MVGRVHGRAGGREGGQGRTGGEGGQGLRRVVRTLGFAVVQGLRVEHRAVSGHGFQWQKITQVGVQRLPSGVVAFVLGHAINITEADGAERASAGRQ